MVYREISRTAILSSLSCYDIILYVIQVPILVRKSVLREVVQSKQNVMRKTMVLDHICLRSTCLLPTAYVVWGKVMFSQACVCSQEGEVWSEGGRVGAWSGKGVCVWSEGARCLVGGGGDGQRGYGDTPSPDTPRYGQPAVGTHPTGMHSCFFIKKGAAQY